MLRKIAIVACMACAAGAGTLCGATYRKEIAWEVQNSDRYQHVFGFADGKFGVRWATHYPEDSTKPDGPWEIEFLGFLLAYSGSNRPLGVLQIHGPAYSVVGPLWLAVLVLLLYPVATLIGRPLRRARRQRNRLCVQCGYNLTGNVSGRCPECGEAIRRIEKEAGGTVA
jgi:hypothetical protein